MKNKKLFKLLTILLGAIICFSFGTAKAVDASSRSSIQTVFSTEPIVPITLEITQSEYKKNSDGAFYWTIKDKYNAYEDFYCLNLKRGFGSENNEIVANNNTKRYTHEHNLNSITDSEYKNITGLTLENKDKILWILNNSITAEDDLSVILNAASEKVDIKSINLVNTSIKNFIKEDMKTNTRNSTKLTFNDIKMVQQIAIWHYTNPGSTFDNTINQICNANGIQISQLADETITIKGTTITNGKIKQVKFNALYDYFIDGAESGSSVTSIPTLTLSNSNTTVKESGDNYIVGPFSLEGTNTSVIKNITANVNKNYTLLNSSEELVNSKNFKEVIGGDFYLKISKSNITQNTQITINLTYTYDIRELKLLTDNNNLTSTQPVVFVVSEEKQNSTATNANIGFTEVIVEKAWNDYDNQDGVRPISVKVQLYQNGVEYGDSKILSNNNNWKYTWNELLDNYTYIVKEINPYDVVVENNKKYDNNYTATYSIVGNKTNITNKHDPIKTSINGIKTWNDADNQDGKRPESITVNLLADGKQVESKTVTSPWIYAFSNLDKYKNGQEIKYTVTENPVQDYTTVIDGYDINNTHIPETIDIEGIKTWKDANNQDGKRPTNITINLLADGQKIDSKTVTAPWTYSFEKLPKYEDGREIVYTITENPVKDYTTTINGYNITNKYTPETIDISGTKTWEDSNNQDGKRPESITVNLLANGEKVESKTVTSPWTYTFTDLPKYENGKEIVYTVTEDTVEDYTTTINGYNIKNTHIPETIDISGTKTWEDYNNQDGKRPESITVKLYADGTEIDKVEVKPDNEGKWEYSFTYLPKYKEGKTIYYTIDEEDVPEYEKIIDEYDITNKYTPETVDISGTKTWEDSNNQDGKRPESIIVNLLANGKKVESKTVTSPWTYSFENLDKYKNGNEIVYTITEDAVEDYTTTINGYDITNKYTPETINVSGTKIWEDADNQDGIRPESITVKLYADGTEIDKVAIEADDKGNWKYSFENLPKYKEGTKIEYTITEDQVNGYATEIDGYNITNIHIPLEPDLALRKYITSINGTEIEKDNSNYRVPQISTENLDNKEKTTARYVHPKNPIQVETGDIVVYNITIYNEGEKDARASEITDQLPTGLKFNQILTSGYTFDYKEATNRLVITKTEENNLAAYTKNGSLSSETIQVECEVIAEPEENNQILTNIAWISEMKDANNNTFEKDIDSNVKDLKSQYNKDNMSQYEGKENDNGYYKGQQDDDDFDRLILLSRGTLDIQIQKVDEEGNIITSSEATFEITGTENVNDKTEQGILDLTSQKLTDNTFEFVYTIKETEAPIAYNSIAEELEIKISGTTKIENEKYVIEKDNITITDKEGNALDSTKVLAEYNEELNKVIIKIVNTKIENSYSVKLLKVGEDGETPISGAWFKIGDDNQPIQILTDGNEIATGKLDKECELDLTYVLEETIAPEGYIKLEGKKEVKIKATVKLEDGQYKLKDVNLVEAIDGITISEENNVITIKIANKVEITGKYNVILRKVNENGDILTGSKFKVNGIEYELSTGEVTILEDTDLANTNDINLKYELNETKAPEGYEEIEDNTININAKVGKDGNTYKLTRVKLVDSNGENITNENISIQIEGNSIVIIVKNTPIQKKFDLALRKFITKINDVEYSREPIVDTSTIANTGTATYKHIKTPIAVQKGDIVTYTIRVYNEGELDGYVDIITDHLPTNLLPILSTVDGINKEKYAKEIEFNESRLWQQIDDERTVSTTITSKSNSEFYSEYTGLENITDTKLGAYVEGNDELDYIDVQIKCLVTENAVSGEYLTNIAEITDAQDINGVKGDGDDSRLSNADISNLLDYKNQEAINSTVESYVQGQEDDDDFEKLVVKEFDLSLRKFITKINETQYSRQPVVDTSKLGTVVDGKTITTAIYNHTKEPVIVETEDLITYTIRIYNEGTLDGYANEITDNIPEGLEFLPNSSVNVSYKWKMLDSEGNETKDVSKASIIVTDYLSENDKNNVIKAVSEMDGTKKLNYKDVQVQFKVVAKAEKLNDNLIINEAQISNDSDRDIDSIPNRNEKYDYTTGNNEDDIDYEPIKLQYFDLALRKFITKVNTVEYNNRYPEIEYNDDGSIKYNHSKEPVLVTTNDTVVYTIRIYNEGEKSGYATEIIDNLPDGLEFITDSEINKEYGWKLIDSEGNVTEDITKAVKASTNYLKDNIILPFVSDSNTKILSYQDVKIEFKVVEPNTSDRILVNIAEISNDSDEDVDSIPGNDVLTEDDIDREYVRVQYFDLSIKKWVTASKVTYNGKTTTTKTGFTEDSEGIAKVDLVASKMNKTQVKFIYSIKVTNEGELPGYAYEIKDYIPNELKFVASDNKDWKETEDGAVVTDKLKDTLLNPGESATVEIVLTWKNSTTNTGLKTNYAEISNDSADDIDSTPNNFNKQEDDIDDAQVILSIKTAGPTTYIGLVLITVTILAGGIFLIKKYVIE